MTGTQLRDWLAEHGVTQVEFAAALGSSQPWVHKLCYNDNELTEAVQRRAEEAQRIVLARKLREAAAQLEGAAR